MKAITLIFEEHFGQTRGSSGMEGIYEADVRFRTAKGPLALELRNNSASMAKLQPKSRSS
jgi:hypothetical protein